MIEKEEDLFCSLKHKLPVLMIACDKELKKNQRLLCPLCMENLEQKSQLMSFKKALENIEENQRQKKESIENFLIINIKQLEELQKALHQLKSNIAQQLDYLIENTSEWIKQIYLWGQSNISYSFFDELEILINQTKLDQSNYKSIFDQINQINQSQNQKISKKLNQFKSFSVVTKSSLKFQTQITPNLLKLDYKVNKNQCMAPLVNSKKSNYVIQEDLFLPTVRVQIYVSFN
ncbi:unnamed protein product [Paramecium primaurelia]|uniref:Uncharacterized protein n=1 Tax=Paramecium primaurelia TaxID=5886 RepID=A0A8S1PPK2_PARPR|nr:unnamed protein product [Paramecium primaurelia]